MKFKINGIDWKIEEKSQEEIKTIINTKKAESIENVKSLDSRFFGVTYPDDLVIYLDKDLPEQRKRLTLLHELTHCYIVTFMTHCDKQYSEEDVCDIVSNSHDIVKNVIDKYFRKENKDETNKNKIK